MEKLCRQLSEKLSEELGYDAEKCSVITYGLIAMTQMGAILVLSVLLALIFHCVPEVLIVYFGVGLLRKATGGAHSRSIYACLIMSVGIIIIFANAARAVSLLTFSTVQQFVILNITVLLFLLQFLIAYKKVPVDTPNKRITNPKKIKKLRLITFATLGVYCVLSFVCILLDQYSYSVSILLASGWQIFTLTKPGHAVVDFFDRIFIRDANAFKSPN